MTVRLPQESHYDQREQIQEENRQIILYGAISTIRNEANRKLKRIQQALEGAQASKSFLDSTLTFENTCFTMTP